MPNGRCKLHGGASISNTNAKKPGSIYSQFLTAEEQELEGAIELGSVDAELRLMRIRLRRALGAETDEPELDETVERDGGGPNTVASEQHYKRRDFNGIIDRITGRIESLERRRLELLLMQKDLAKDHDANDLPPVVQVIVNGVDMSKPDGEQTAG